MWHKARHSKNIATDNMFKYNINMFRKFLGHWPGWHRMHGMWYRPRGVLRLLRRCNSTKWWFTDNRTSNYYNIPPNHYAPPNNYDATPNNYHAPPYHYYAPPNNYYIPPNYNNSPPNYYYYAPPNYYDATPNNYHAPPYHYYATPNNHNTKSNYTPHYYDETDCKTDNSRQQWFTSQNIVWSSGTLAA